jgi:glycosyltransferase involved in cell wall biosynthesis
VRIVLTIHHELDRNSGSPGTTIALAEAYERAGHEAEILSFDDLPARLGPQARMVAFPLLVARRLAGSLGRSADVVDTSSGDAWLWSLARGSGARGPLLATRSHGLEHREHAERLHDHRQGRVELRRRYFAYHGGMRLREVAVSLRRAELAFFLNNADLEFGVRHLGVERGRSYLVRNGIDTGFLGLPAPEPVSRDGVGIALIARHTAGMGAGYSTPALERILTRHPSVRVTLLGSATPEADVLRDFAAAVRSRITVVPAYDRAELPRLLAGHELLVSAKFSEGFGKALVEAMACGLAPVVVAAAGPATILEHERTGLLVQPRDNEAMVAAIDRALFDPTLRQRLRAAAHEEAQRYTWESVAAERLELMQAAIDRRSGRTANQRAGDARRTTPHARENAPPDRPVAPDVDREQVA